MTDPLQQSTDAFVTLPITGWNASVPEHDRWQRALEAGKVIYCPNLSFELEDFERKFLAAEFSDEKRKSIYIRAGSTALIGAQASEADRAVLLAMIRRYETASTTLVKRLFPSYAALMRSASTSYRPRPSGGRALSWRKDDTRLHTDAFPSNPTLGMRILRVFTNIGTAPRRWRVGEPFETVAAHFFPRIPKHSPWSARALHAVGITKKVRSAYDHYMLHLHDEAKRDLEYQKDSAQHTVEFPPGSSWICFSDQVMHAAMAGQFMMEQTIHVPPAALAHPETAPLAALERLAQRALL